MLTKLPWDEPEYVIGHQASVKYPVCRHHDPEIIAGADDPENWIWLPLCTTESSLIVQSNAHVLKLGVAALSPTEDWAESNKRVFADITVYGLLLRWRQPSGHLTTAWRTAVNLFRSARYRLLDPDEYHVRHEDAALAALRLQLAGLGADTGLAWQAYNLLPLRVRRSMPTYSPHPRLVAAALDLMGASYEPIDPPTVVDLPTLPAATSYEVRVELCARPRLSADDLGLIIDLAAVAPHANTVVEEDGDDTGALPYRLSTEHTLLFTVREPFSHTMADWTKRLVSHVRRAHPTAMLRLALTPVSHFHPITLTFPATEEC